MIIFVAVLLTLLTLFFIAYPFFKQKWSSTARDEDEKFRELHSRRDTTYSMLKELEFDYQSGILTEEDYRDLEARYKRKAISILKDTDDLEKGGEAGGDVKEPVQKARPVKRNDLDVEVEEEVLKLRKVKGANANDEVEGEVLKLRQSKGGDSGKAVEEEVSRVRKGQGKFCSQCGAKANDDDRFCAGCGAKLK